MQPPKKWYLSLTLWYNVLMFLLEWTAHEKFTSIIPPSWIPYLVALQTGGTIFLRIFVTKAPLQFRS